MRCAGARGSVERTVQPSATSYSAEVLNGCLRRVGAGAWQVTDGDLHEVFALVDTDNSGTVSAEEFDAFLEDPSSVRRSRYPPTQCAVPC